MKIIVTGATGFVGSHLMEEFVGSKHKVIGMGRSEKNIVPGFDYYLTSLENFADVDEIFKEQQPEVVYHLAAKSAESTGEHSPIEMTVSGYNTFFNVITAAIRTGKLKKFIYVSSAAVYGNIETPYHENQRPEPNDIYAVTKYANELSLQILAKTYGFDYVIIRPHNITGERQEYTDPTRNVVVLFMQLLRMGKKPKIFGKGTSTRCYTYVKDVTLALKNCLKVKNAILNVGSDEKTTIQQLYDEIIKVSGIKIDPEYLPERRQEVDINTVDHTHARKLFNPYPETSFKETIQKTWNWLSNQPLKPFDVKKKEIDLK